MGTTGITSPLDSVLDSDVSVPHENVAAFLDVLEEAAREHGCVPMIVGAAHHEAGVVFHLAPTAPLDLRESSHVLSRQKA